MNELATNLDLRLEVLGEPYSSFLVAVEVSHLLGEMGEASPGLQLVEQEAGGLEALHLGVAEVVYLAHFLEGQVVGD